VFVETETLGLSRSFPHRRTQSCKTVRLRCR
jgi:hypothetical protein